MKMTYDVTHEDGNTQRVQVRPRSILQYEKLHKVSLADSVTMTAIYWLTWHAITGGAGKFEEWIENVLDVSPVEDEADPLDLALQPGD